MLADRRSNNFLSSGRIEQLERACGQACLAALAAVPLEEQHVAAEEGTLKLAAQQQQQASRAA